MQHAGKERKNLQELVRYIFYQDVPLSVFPYEIEICYENERPFLMATPEKAVCDKLCTVKPIRSRKHLQQLLFDDLRIDQDAFSNLIDYQAQLMAYHAQIAPVIMRYLN
ncbi:hypothetical protein, partial [Faecalibaculum rodentium]|uniref:hypothetical protein n=1 Tax=Faecalibaculum rodentium TaxID=1702221 RepID=UPI003518E4F6